MLHNFSTTAYEIDDYNDKVLANYDIMKVVQEDRPQLRWETIELDKEIIEKNNTTNLLKYKAASIKFEGVVPGDFIYIKIENEPAQKIVFGATGSYEIDLRKNIKIEEVYFENDD
jgi:hypothetical protein